jgi:transcriptional regulator with XRE-family HTH domain
MELGQRIKEARLAAGLSQRQLCGDTITRNMLSRIENGSARPSMDTLGYLAKVLGKPVGYFLEEEAVLSPNQDTMVLARLAFSEKDFDRVLTVLENYREPDPVFDWERFFLEGEACLSLAEKALTEERVPYGLHLLDRADRAGEKTPYYGFGQRHRGLLLRARGGEGYPNAGQLGVEEALLCLAQRVMAEDPAQAVVLLDVGAQPGEPRWLLARAKAAMALGDHAQAAGFLAQAEGALPEEVVPLLERCYRELGDYKMAYFYACKQKK